MRFRIKYQNPDFKFPFVIRLDISEGKIFLPIETTSIITQFPIINFPIVVHLSQKEIFAEKIRALLGRSKGRDLYDVWYLLEKKLYLIRKL
jgi:predicted nucleotidyltransferase component of viral defense system